MARFVSTSELEGIEWTGENIEDVHGYLGPGVALFQLTADIDPQKHLVLVRVPPSSDYERAGYGVCNPTACVVKRGAILCQTDDGGFSYVDPDIYRSAPLDQNRERKGITNK